MCGIVGYLGNGDTKNLLLNGLKELEYRGYDSAGIAILDDKSMQVSKAVGKLNNLIDKAKEISTEESKYRVGIAHIRWATHGKPTELNAHPHLGKFSFVVHNGIIENYKEIKTSLESKGVIFNSQTDTEVIVHLFEEFLEEYDDTTIAFAKTIQSLKGAFAILLITKKEPNRIFFAKNQAPLLIGLGEELFFASSDSALIDSVKEVIYLNDGEFGVAEGRDYKIFRDDFEIIKPTIKTISVNRALAQKCGFRFFMEKEIYEQGEVVSETLMGRVKERIYFDELEGLDIDSINEIIITACGTSYHAGLSGSYLFERLAKISVRVEIASEFRYKEPVLNPNALFIVISQSGETADTLQSLKMAKEAGLKTLVICNVDNSTMVREADYSILTRAGIEKGVASTKAFATQLSVLWMLALFIGDKKSKISNELLNSELKALISIPSILKVDVKLHEKLKRISKKYLHGHGFFFIGRDIFYPLALEGALKLKEISYFHAEGYPAGEMKHGPIALADSELFTIALMPKNLLYEKIKSNVEELSARDSTIVAISSEYFDIVDDFIEIKESSHYMFEFFEMMVVLQLFAMEIAIRLGNDVDMPRNLAKSVTVE